MRADTFYLIGGLLLSVAAGSALGQVHGYELLSDWDALPLAKDFRAGMASSYDRSGGNNDWNHYEHPTGWLTDTDPNDGIQEHHDIPVTVTELTGPGVLTRFWMPHADANVPFPLKVYVDGQLRIDTDSDTYLAGAYGYASAPLTDTLVGGQYSYEPIVFQDSLRIESRNYTTGGWAKTHHYYQWGYQSLPSGTQVQAYTGTLSSEQQSARQAAVDMINNAGSNPAGAGATSSVRPTGASTIAAGSSLTLCDQSGSGTIRRLNLKMASGATDADLDALKLRVRYGDRNDYAIDVPVSHFFGAGHGRADYQSLPLGASEQDGFYSYWPMPFRQGVTVELVNEGGQAVAIDSAAVEYEGGVVAADAGYLHAAYNEQQLAAGEDSYRILEVDAAEGHYVGNMLYLQQDDLYRAILEGDETITVDGEVVIRGTGLEDAYNGGYYYNHVLEQAGEEADPTSGTGPFSGLLRMNFDDLGDEFVRTDQYRWYIGDPVPFEDGIIVDMENHGNRAALYGSTAFYYVVPEPASLMLMGLGAVALVRRRRHV